MNLCINGELRQFSSSSLSLETLFSTLNVSPKMKIVELNGTLYSEGDFSSVSLYDGDIVEIVQFIGGGK